VAKVEALKYLVSESQPYVILLYGETDWFDIELESPSYIILYIMSNRRWYVGAHNIADAF
jgi:hypothetical protein